MEKLTLVAVSELAEGEDIREIRWLDASGKGVTLVEDLSPCVELTKLNLSKNSIESMGRLVCCKTLTWLDLSHNQLDSLVGIQALTNLAGLKALILSSNRLSGLTGLSALQDLNTLVLSHNCLKSISVEKLTKLTKLSLSHNSLRAIPDVQHNVELRELRLNGNRIASVPESLKHNSRLALLDLGNNKIRDLSFLDVLRRMRSLKNLNLKGNTLCDNSDDYQGKVLDAIQSVQVLDGRKRASVIVLGGGKRKASGMMSGILKSPSPKKSGGNVVGTGEDKAVRKKVRFNEPYSEETRPKKRKRKHEGDECERLEGIISVDDGEPAARPKIRKRNRKEDCLLGGTPQQKEDYLLGATPQRKKPRLGREDSQVAAASSVNQKKHVRKKKQVHEFRVDVGGPDHSLLSVPAGTRRRKQFTDLGPQSKKGDVGEDASIPSLTVHEPVVTSREEEPGLVPTSRKSKKSNVKMHSGVVSVERAKSHHRRRKTGHGYSPTGILLEANADIGVGHKSTWT